MDYIYVFHLTYFVERNAYDKRPKARRRLSFVQRPNVKSKCSIGRVQGISNHFDILVNDLL